MLTKPSSSTEHSLALAWRARNQPLWKHIQAQAREVFTLVALILSYGKGDSLCPALSHTLTAEICTGSTVSHIHIILFVVSIRVDSIAIFDLHSILPLFF